MERRARLELIAECAALDAWKTGGTGCAEWVVAWTASSLVPFGPSFICGSSPSPRVSAETLSVEVRIAGALTEFTWIEIAGVLVDNIAPTTATLSLGALVWHSIRSLARTTR